MLCVKNNDFEYGSFIPKSDIKVRKNDDLQLLPEVELQKKNKKALKIEKQPVEKTGKNQTKTKSKNRQTDKPARVKNSIGTQLILIISTIVSFSLITITLLVSYYVSNDTKISAEGNNLTINSRTASDVENRFNNYISVTGMLYDNISVDDDPEELDLKAEKFFQRNKEIVALNFLYDRMVFAEQDYFASNEINRSLIEDYALQESDAVALAKNGEVSVQNATAFFGNRLLAIFTPVRSDENSDVVIILISSEEMFDSFSTGATNLSFLVNKDGMLLVHPDLELMNNAADFSRHFLVSELMESTAQNQQNTYKDENGVEYIGAYRKLNLGSCAVVTEARTDIIYEGVRATTRRNIYLTIAILSLAIMIVWFFSKSLSTPLKELTQVTNEINSGNFETHLLAELQTKRKDEIGILIQSTKAEQEILNTFTRLTNKGVTRAIVTKKIDFQPHLKDITIFFSDIRGFTAISDGFNKRFGEKSAGEIIGFLNDYMGRMVNCISISGGNVDKFEGDAIMACWGVLRDDKLDYEQWPDTDPRKEKFRRIHEKHVKQDAVSAIMATTAMRYALMEYNKKAELFTKKHEGEPLAKYKPHIRIGSGLNSGRATVGFMGSYDKMEFTSIGDAVNLASRTESSNKPCGTDMLITEDTYNLLKMDYIRCAENNFTIKPENLKYEVIVEVIPVTFEVKGKGKQHFYGVVNMPNFNIEEFFRKSDPKFKVDPDCAKAIGPKGPKTLAEVRTLLGIPTPDFGEVNLDAEENKIKAT